MSTYLTENPFAVSNTEEIGKLRREIVRYDARIRDNTKRLMELERVPAPSSEVYRVESKAIWIVYGGGRIVCECHSEADAERIVGALNALAGAR